ncbi:MAG: cell division protein ZipA [Gammaproteobacteria bacterium]|nr:MAG: cell division protein ZipA [Gammaproteobacteria bacterium]
MSNWLTAVIVLLIIIILADGIRRTLNARRNRIDVSPALKKRIKNPEPEYEEENQTPPSYISELPNGGARVVAVRDPSERPQRESLQRERKLSARELKEQRRREAAAKRTPEQTRLNLDESVPILMESVEHQEEHKSDEHGRIEPSFSEQDNEDLDHEEHDLHAEQDDHEDQVEDEGDYDEEYEEEFDEDEDEESESDDDYAEEDDSDEDEIEEEEEEEEEEKAAAPQAEPEEVLIINIMAQKGEVFNGSDLLDIVLKCGLRYGSMDIFHRYSDTKGDGALLFSMANMVRPGTFDLDAMDEFTTPGVSLFMTLPIDADSMQSFDLMAETAQAISQTLHGELKDEQRSAMTKQTLEHSRQRIRDFERKKLFRRPR